MILGTACVSVSLSWHPVVWHLGSILFTDVCSVSFSLQPLFGSWFSGEIIWTMSCILGNHHELRLFLTLPSALLYIGKCSHAMQSFTSIFIILVFCVYGRPGWGHGHGTVHGCVAFTRWLGRSLSFPASAMLAHTFCKMPDVPECWPLQDSLSPSAIGIIQIP